ncbi:MAG: hypothetical protein Faunusvirus55_5 [Faunusvirus sp.]|jgi:ankyrin repeat protein|uniref:Uncharacterized protein n=1 Tax=Faunusvirus sp. TaxID=2487766 RepID=A0A3G4ZY09_9VIRU|nr:MAG: hypothetical protein Faunusvirus55_5 [Faunusvirus sp.]
MQTANAHRDEFARLIRVPDIRGCLKYIDTYDDFYDAILDFHPNANMLQLACNFRLDRVAFALIDKKCNLTYQNKNGVTAMMYANCYELKDVVTYIIDKLTDITTRNISHGLSEMMYICDNQNTDNVIKMIDLGYDIYYINKYNESLFTRAMDHNVEQVVTKLIDIDTDFIDQLEQYYDMNKGCRDKTYHNIMKYCADKHDAIKREIIATMNDVSPTNMLYQSFRSTYAVQLTNIICDYIILHVLPIKKS